MASARQKAKQIQEAAELQHENARRSQAQAVSKLKKKQAEHVDAFEDRVIPSLRGFEQAIARFAELRFCTAAENQGHVVNAIETPTLRLTDDGYGAVFASFGFGGATGSALAGGTYLGFSTFGAASTGTAISSLSGVAAQNATLAAIGGGSLATGGGGMVAGTVVLGGITVVPIVVVGGLVYWHKGKKNLANAETNVALIDENVAMLRADQVRADCQSRSIERLTVTADLLACELAARTAVINELPLEHEWTKSHDPYLARTAALAECLATVASVAACGPKGGPTHEARAAIDGAKRLLALEEV